MKKYEREGIHCVENLKEGRGDWIVNNRQPGKLWESECIGLLRGIGKKAINMLETKLGIETIGNFNKWYSVPANIDAFLRDASGWIKKRLETLMPPQRHH
eukprot:8989248-Ditylum_brightwellii.AAC.1